MKTFYAWAKPGYTSDLLTGPEQLHVGGVRNHPDTSDHIIVAEIRAHDWEAAKRVHQSLEEVNPALVECIHSGGRTAERMRIAATIRDGRCGGSAEDDPEDLPPYERDLGCVEVGLLLRWVDEGAPESDSDG